MLGNARLHTGLLVARRNLNLHVQFVESGRPCQPPCVQQPLSVLCFVLLPCLYEQSAQSAGGPSCRPLVFALSNPTEQAEVTFEQALQWTGGAAVYASGSPFPALTNPAGRVLRPAQANNCFVFPGLAQGILDGGVRHVDDALLLVAAEALAGRFAQALEPV